MKDARQGSVSRKGGGRERSKDQKGKKGGQAYPRLYFSLPFPCRYLSFPLLGGQGETGDCGALRLTRSDLGQEMAM